MKIGRILGRVVSTTKLESLEGIKLLLVQPLDEKLNIVGDAIVAADTIQSGPGDLIYYEISKEASRVIETRMNPVDAAIMGKIDEIFIDSKK